jgi:hypothetical protein
MFGQKFLVIAYGFVAAATFITPALAEPTFRVIVEGGGDSKALQRLQLFDQKLRSDLGGIEDLALANIGCAGCENLTSNATSLTYFIPERTTIILAFAIAWRHVQTYLPHDLFKLELDSVPPPQQACPAVANCKFRAACPPTNYCDKPYGGACNAC